VGGAWAGRAPGVPNSRSAGASNAAGDLFNTDPQGRVFGEIPAGDTVEGVHRRAEQGVFGAAELAEQGRVSLRCSIEQWAVSGLSIRASCRSGSGTGRCQVCGRARVAA
jgi:hypothetical protein